MTETISHWADGKRQDGYSDRTGPVFGFPTGKEEVRVAYDAGELHIHAGIKVRMQGEMVETTTGRTLLAEIVPPESPAESVGVPVPSSRCSSMFVS